MWELHQCIMAQISEWTATEYGIIMTAVGTFLGVFLTKLATFVNLWRSGRIAEKKADSALDLEEDQQIEDQMKYVIRRSDRMLARAESEVRQLREQYTRAIEALAEANTRVEFLTQQLAEERARIERYRRMLNQRGDKSSPPMTPGSSHDSAEGHSL